MTQDRRTFLKTTALAGAAAAAGVPFTATAPLAQKAAVGSQVMPRGFVFATLRRQNGYGLGVRTDRGVLDVVAAEQELKEGAPVTISDVFDGKGDLAGLRRLVEKAKDTHFVAIDKAAFGPCVTHPEKIICVGLNYRKHAAETGNPVPKAPILFNKFNTALNHHGGVIGVSEEDAQKFDYEAELVIVIGKTARNVSEADAPGVIFGYATGNDFTARDLQSRSSQWMLGKALDGSAPVGPWLVTADLADGDNLKIECRVNGEGPAVIEHLRHGVQLQAARELRVEVFHPQARRHDLHRHAGGRDLRLSEGQAGVAQGRRQARDLDREARRPGIQADLTPRAEIA